MEAKITRSHYVVRPLLHRWRWGWDLETSPADGGNDWKNSPGQCKFRRGHRNAICLLAANILSHRLFFPFSCCCSGAIEPVLSSSILFIQKLVLITSVFPDNLLATSKSCFIFSILIYLRFIFPRQVPPVGLDEPLFYNSPCEQSNYTYLKGRNSINYSIKDIFKIQHSGQL